jgi:serine/threonine protein kinase
MSAREERIPTQAELQAYSLGKLEPQRAGEVEAHLAAHPELLLVVSTAEDDEVVRHLRGAGPLPTAQRQSLLLNLAVEGVLPVLGGCAGTLAGGPEGGLVGIAVGQVVEKGINFFGLHIVARWLEWLRRQPPATRVAALVELAELTPEEARREVTAALTQLAPQASPTDRQVAIDYLSAIPRSVQRSLLSDRALGGKTLPPALSLDDSQSLLQLLPANVPPYAVPADLPGTEYRLEELVGTGGFGAVYRASARSLQHLPLAIKFCLDRSLLPGLLQERTNLERLMKAGAESWSPRLVRLYGYNLEHRTPYLVYEHVSGGDLVHWLVVRQARDRGLTPAEVLDLIVQVAEGLTFAHQRGLVHRDLKPANVLMGEGTIKLADFGIGGLVARQAFQVSRIGTTASSRLSPAEQASLFRGAGTPLYMAPEQRRGEAPDPRHDLYSLGVMWYQLLVGDVTQEMSHGWARELAVKHAVPREQIDLIERCVGWIEERPRNAGELLKLLRPGGEVAARTTDGQEEIKLPRSGGEEASYRHLHLVSQMVQLWEHHVRAKREEEWWSSGPGWRVWIGLMVLTIVTLGIGAMFFALVVFRREALGAKIKDMVAEFPEECQTWGGKSALANPIVVEAILREMARKARRGDGLLEAEGVILERVLREMEAKKR